MYALTLVHPTWKPRTRTSAEIDTEAYRLRSIMDRVACQEIDAISAQLEVIEDRMTLDEVCEAFDDAHPDVMSAALYALDWLRAEEMTPSDDWLMIMGGANAVSLN